MWPISRWLIMMPINNGQCLLEYGGMILHSGCTTMMKNSSCQSLIACCLDRHKAFWLTRKLPFGVVKSKEEACRFLYQTYRGMVSSSLENLGPFVLCPHSDLNCKRAHPKLTKSSLKSSTFMMHCCNLSGQHEDFTIQAFQVICNESMGSVVCLK